MTKYIFLDVDGTLYSPATCRTPDSAVKALRLARENGHRIFLCTGRSLAEATMYLHYDVDGFIFGAGSMIYVEKKRIYDEPIPADEVKKLKELIRSQGMGFTLEGAAGVYCSDDGYEAVMDYFGGGAPTREGKIEKLNENCIYREKYGNEENDKIYKICAFGECWKPEFTELEGKLWDPYILTKSMEIPEKHFCCGEVTNSAISKATAIIRILGHYGASQEQAVGIGDSANDIPMFGVCRCSIAMGNGTPDCKEAASWVTTDIEEDGILNAFLHAGVITKEQAM